MEKLRELLAKKNLQSRELLELLKARKEGKINFTLIDIREQFEYDEAYIDGCDELLPTSKFQEWASKLLERKNENIIIYCRTGNRTGQVQSILTQHGLNVPHLVYGIVDYQGDLKNIQ